MELENIHSVEDLVKLFESGKIKSLKIGFSDAVFKNQNDLIDYILYQCCKNNIEVESHRFLGDEPYMKIDEIIEK